MHKTVRMILAGEIVEVHDCEPTRTVLEFLREDKHLKGTKEGCAEGDCGACTVVIGELHNDGIRYRAINSCIQFLPSLDGKQLITVEDLASSDGNGLRHDNGHQLLHPVQQALVEQHGSQCGFCTPGFVMSLFAMFHQDKTCQVPQYTAQRADIDLGLAGNLCRCTGYAPIIRAAEQALNGKRDDHFTANESRIITLLKQIQATETLHLNHRNGIYYAPDSVSALCTLMDRHPDAVLLAGATDVGLWVTKQQRALTTIIYLGAIAELRKISNDGSHLSIGATVSYTDAQNAITAWYPAFGPLIDRIGATQVRNAGTIGGNIANGSPIGDMPPGLIAIGARLVLRNSQHRRMIDLEDYFIRYGQQDLGYGEFLEQIHLPEPPGNQLFATYKVTKRREQDISSVCAAYAIEVDHGIISKARVCYGGMAETPKRALLCEQVLTGEHWNQEAIDRAKLALLEDYSPITDMRATASYRQTVAQNLLQRFFLENTSPTYAVQLETQSVQPGHDRKTKGRHNDA